MSRVRLRRLERATRSAARQIITVFNALPDLPLPDDDTANPAYAPGPSQGPTYVIKPAAQAAGGLAAQAEVLRMVGKEVA
jgi:hypothetical protein